MSFFKSLLLGVKKKIWEPIIILLAVALAVATFVSALTLRSSVRRTAEESYRALSGNCELEASFSDDFSTYYLTADNKTYLTLKTEAEKYGDFYGGYLFYCSLGDGEDAFAEVYATDLSLLSSYNAVELSEGEVLAESGASVVLSQTFAKKIGAKVGDLITASRYGSERSHPLLVTGIARQKGVFREVDALLSSKGAARILSLGDSVTVYNKFFIDLSEKKTSVLNLTSAEAAALLAAANPAFIVQNPVKENNVEVTLSYQSTLLFLIAVISAVLGVILIYTAVSLVMKNRVSLAALFKSVGATERGIALYLLAEVALYGFVGSLVGLGASFGVSALFGAMTGAIVTFSVGWAGALLGILFGVVLALVAALVPVIKLSILPLYDLLHESSPVRAVRVLPACVSAAVFALLFVCGFVLPVSAAFTVGVFAFLALLAALFALLPLVVKGGAFVLTKWTANKPRARILHLAASGAKHNRHAHSGARLLAIALMAVAAVGALLGEAKKQLSSFDTLFVADIVISAKEDQLPLVAAEAKNVEGVSAAYLAYVGTRCELEGEKGNTVTLLAARGQEYDEVFNAESFGVDVDSFRSEEGRYAALGGGLAIKMGLSVGDTFALVVEGKRVEFTLASLIDTPLTVVFADLSSLGVPANVCLAKGGEEGRKNLAEKYALEGAVYSSKEAFGYVRDLALAYIKVFTVFEILVCVFALAGYINTAIAAYRDRKRERELLLSAGASRGDLNKLVLSENALVFLISAAMGVLSSVLLLFVVQNMLKTIGLYFSLLT